MRVLGFVNLVVVITAHLKLFSDPVTPHYEPGADIQRDGNLCRSNCQTQIGRRPLVFLGEVEFSPFELGILCVDEKGRYMFAANRTFPINGLYEGAGAKGQSSQRGLPAEIAAV